jgi:hypothetical protein
MQVIVTIHSGAVGLHGSTFGFSPTATCCSGGARGIAKSRRVVLLFRRTRSEIYVVPSRQRTRFTDFKLMTTSPF